MNVKKEFWSGRYISGFTGFLTNVGDTNSFTLSDGIFKSPRNGIFEFSASVFHWGVEGTPNNILAVVKNGVQVLKFVNGVGNPLPDLTLTFNWFMELKKDDKVRLQVVSGVFVCGGYGDTNDNNCIFNGKHIKS